MLPLAPRMVPGGRRSGGQRGGRCSHQAYEDVACAAAGTVGRREAGGCERDVADNLVTPACSPVRLNSWL